MIRESGLQEMGWLGMRVVQGVSGWEGKGTTRNK